jgi:hypothetical protein
MNYKAALCFSLLLLILPGCFWGLEFSGFIDIIDKTKEKQLRGKKERNQTECLDRIWNKQERTGRIINGK